MTADDLRIQKGLAMLEVEETKQSAEKASAEFDALVADVGTAADLLRQHYQDDAVFRELIGKYEHVIKVDAILKLWDKKRQAWTAAYAAQDKLKVFRS